MTERARLVLSDAEFALGRLELVEDPVEYRVMWFALLGLLRAVGHVLKKVDSADDRLLEKAVNQAWDEWTRDPAQHEIFHDFVDVERNILLKQYESRYEKQIGPALLFGRVFELEARLFLPMPTGRFAGEDGRDLARYATMWWHAQLNAIDSRVVELEDAAG